MPSKYLIKYAQRLRAAFKRPQVVTDAAAFDDDAESRLKNTLFIVEATSTEQFMLWKDYAQDSDSPRYKPMRWEQVNPGWMITYGSLERRPCCMSVSWRRIDGQLIMFWYQCSQVTDSVQAEAWLTRHFSGKWDKGTRRAWGDASNFHHCVDAIEEANSGAVYQQLRRS